MQVKEALEEYLVQLDGDGRSIHTLRQARRHIMKLAEWLASTGHSGKIEDVQPGDLARFFASPAVKCREDGGERLPTSANALRSSVRAFFRFAHDAGFIPTNPSRLVRRAICSDPPPRAVSDDDAGKLFAVLDAATGPVAERDRMFFKLLAATGIRVGSAVALDVTDVDVGQGVLRLRRMKGGQRATAFVPPETMVMLRGFIGERTKGPLFVSAAGRRVGTRSMGVRLHAWLRRAGVEPFGAHAFRHAFGMKLYRETGDLLLTSRALNHKALSSTTTYARADESKVRAALSAR